MTAVRTRPAATALEPVRSAVLRRARADADGVRAAAEADAARVRAAAEAKAAETLARARAEGAADAVELLETQRARTRRSMRARELAAQRVAHDDLRRLAVDAVRERLRDGPGRELREALVVVARRLLGPHAVLTDAPGGGIEAEAGGRRVDLTLDALTARAVDRLGADLDGLWSA
ncbi:hypothetical protein [Promicromonospora soli]